MQIVIAYARPHVTCTPCAKFGYIFEFPTSTLPIHYDTYWAPTKIKGCFVQRPKMLNAKSSENFLSRPKLGKFWRFWGPVGQGFQRVAIFTPRGTSLREPTSFEPVCVKIGQGV